MSASLNKLTSRHGPIAHVQPVSQVRRISIAAICSRRCWMRRDVFRTGSPTPRPRHGMTPKPRQRPLNMLLGWQHLSSSATSGLCPRRVPPAAPTGCLRSWVFTQAIPTSNGSVPPARNAVGLATLCRSWAAPKPTRRVRKNFHRRRGLRDPKRTFA